MVLLVFARTMPAMLRALHRAPGLRGLRSSGLTDSIALERVRQGADYGRIRIWGSFAFALVQA